MPVSQSYLNDLGTWAYTIKCPVNKENEEIGALYIEYIYDSFDKALPGGFYNGKAMLYIMDAKRFVRMVLRIFLPWNGSGCRNGLSFLDLRLLKPPVQ